MIPNTIGAWRHAAGIRKTAGRNPRLLGRRNHALLLLGMQTGLRLSELTGVRKEDLTLEGGANVSRWQPPQRALHTTRQTDCYGSQKMARGTESGEEDGSDPRQPFCAQGQHRRLSINMQCKCDAGLSRHLYPSRFARQFREQRPQLVYLLPTRSGSDGRDTQLLEELIQSSGPFL